MCKKKKEGNSDGLLVDNPASLNEYTYTEINIEQFIIDSHVGYTGIRK